MGHSSRSKFSFPLPGRRSKPAATQPPPQVSGPLTKAQKLLGTAQITVDPQLVSTDSTLKWPWDSRPRSGISIAVSETTASYGEPGEGGLGIVHEGEVASPSPRRELRWEDESDIIPRGFNRQSGMAMGDVTTDASSLRRRQSSSTITSFYDKTKQPLSISQQTSNSAMAKGVPAKVHAMLDMDGTVSGPKEKEKKKPSRLDLSSLFSKSMSQRHLRPDVDRSHVLGPDMMTKSPSVLSLSPAVTPPPIKQRHERFPRKKKTVESLRDMQPVPESRQQRQPPNLQHHPTRRPGSSPTPGGHRASKSTVNLYNLYDHYEQRSFADAADKETHDAAADLKLEDKMAEYPPPPTSSPGKKSVPPLPGNRLGPPNPVKPPPEMFLSSALSPLSLISPPADSASISSRHTRTSKASKRTDRSLTELDLQQNSVLSLSSDSEDDTCSYDPSFRNSLTVPALSDGRASPTSPRSAMSQRSSESGRSRPPKRASFAASPQFLPIPEGGSPSHPPKATTTRVTSMAQDLAAKPAANKTKPDMRMSIASTSTSKTLVFGIGPNDQPHGPKIISMMRRNSPPNQPIWPPTSEGSEFEDFPAPPGYGPHRPSLSGNSDHHPVSPTSVDFYLQSQHNSLAGFDGGSTHSSKSFSSASLAGGGGGERRGSAGRRGSAASSVNDRSANANANDNGSSSSGRFMAVTKQEEMLLAALRMKRARMREDIIAEFEEDMDRGDGEPHLDRHVTNDSSGASSSRISRQSSASTMRTFENLNMRPQHHHQQQQQPQIQISTGSTEKLDTAKTSWAVRPKAPLMLDDCGDNVSSVGPSPNLDDFVDFDDESFGLPLQRHSILVEPAGKERSGSKSRSRSSSKSGPIMSTSKGPRLSTSSIAVQVPKQTQTLGQQDHDAVSPRCVPPTQRGLRDGVPPQILEEEPHVEDEAGVPRPDSPISPASFPVPMAALTRKKQVRLSAVGNHQINIEAGWWNDSG